MTITFRINHLPMATCILHIGSGKTGSTSIQKALHSSLNVERNSTYSYPLVDGHKFNQAFRLAFCKISQCPINIRARFKDNDLKFLKWQSSIRDKFREAIDVRKDLIISSEFLFISSSEEADSIIDFLQTLGYKNIHAIGYIREPSSYYLSAAQQRLKSRPDLPRVDEKIYSISSAISVWDDKTSSLVLRDFRRSNLIGHNVVSDFFHIVSNLCGSPLSCKVSEGESNRSLPAEATQALQDMHI